MEPTQTQTNIVDVYVNYLRRKLEDPPPGRVIRTVRGHGYMVPPESELTVPELVAAPIAAAITESPAETVR